MIRIKAAVPGEFADIWRFKGGKKKTENPSFCSESGFCAARWWRPFRYELHASLCPCVPLSEAADRSVRMMVWNGSELGVMWGARSLLWEESWLSVDFKSSGGDFFPICRLLWASVVWLSPFYIVHWWGHSSCIGSGCSAPAGAALTGQWSLAPVGTCTFLCVNWLYVEVKWWYNLTWSPKWNTFFYKTFFFAIKRSVYNVVFIKFSACALPGSCHLNSVVPRL